MTNQDLIVRMLNKISDNRRADAKSRRLKKLLQPQAPASGQRTALIIGVLVLAAVLVGVGRSIRTSVRMAERVVCLIAV